MLGGLIAYQFRGCCRCVEFYTLVRRNLNFLSLSQRFPDDATFFSLYGDHYRDMLIPQRSAANSRQARMSTSVNSGKSSKISA
jgi:hypothetical protein